MKPTNKAPDPTPSFGDTSDRQLTGKGDAPLTFSELQGVDVATRVLPANCFPSGFTLATGKPK
jgi:hypothetical protein